METLEDLYSFYLENCVDETKNEIPLCFEEWVVNNGKEELEYNLINKDLQKQAQ